METLVKVFKNTGALHHAYVIEGNSKNIFLDLVSFLEKSVGIKTRGNPDFYYESFDSFGVDDARTLKEKQQKKSFEVGGKKVFIISFNFITREAQNSLLKVFEEPTAGTHFFLIVPTAEIFLPTVRSRVMIFSQKDFTDTDEKFIKDFLASSPKKRLDLVAEIIEEKDKARAIIFLDNLEASLSKMWSKNPDTQKAEVFKQTINCRNYLYDRAPSVKIILEHIALVTPVVMS